MDPSLTLFRSIIVPAIGLIAIIVVGWFAITGIRRWMRSGDEGAVPFTLDDLRRMRREGQLTDEEYETARAAMIGEARKNPPPSVAEIKRRVQAGANATAQRSAPPTTPDSPLRITPENGTQPPKSPKRPPQLG